jgi:tRNA threonylcarbamoyladenosine biosynthesis protein TsaE
VTAKSLSDSGSAAETEALGERLAVDLAEGDIVLLQAELAAGKTTFVRGMVRGLGGVSEDVSSPTFVLIQSYDCTRGGIRVVHHVDLYRVDEPISGLREIGLEEMLSDASAVIAVEWPKETIAAWIPAGTRVWRVRITVGPDETRLIEIMPPIEDNSKF